MATMRESPAPSRRTACSAAGRTATILHCLGIDYTRLVYRYQGRDFRPTEVHGQVVTALLA